MIEEPFVKVISPGGWDFGIEPAQLIKVSSRGLRGNDFKEFVKRASYGLAEMVRKLTLLPGDIPTHDIIVGATEIFGPNRNGDGFRKKACRDFHHTFVKHGRAYRDHDNKDPKKSYGIVKLSSFNEDMARIELVTVYNGTKEAAERNGGLVADVEIEKLARGEDFPTSMSCLVPFDVCSSCGNQAKNRKKYCRGFDDGGSCPGGGLYRKIATFIDDPKNPVLHADNTRPLFFDKSRVVRGADRIAFAMGLNKAASADIRGGAHLAEILGVSAPRNLLVTGRTGAMLKLASQLADLESKLPEVTRLQLAFAPQVQPTVSWQAPNCKMGEALQALAMSKVAMPVEGFLEFIGYDPETINTVAPHVKANLPGIYSRLVKTGAISTVIDNNPFTPATTMPPLRARQWAEKLSSYSLEDKLVETRIVKAAVATRGQLDPLRRASFVKLASPAAKVAEEVASWYAGYQLSALTAMGETGADSFGPRFVVVQNCAK